MEKNNIVEELKKGRRSQRNQEKTSRLELHKHAPAQSQGGSNPIHRKRRPKTKPKTLRPRPRRLHRNPEKSKSLDNLA
jgi:hypothetical protein